LSSRAGAGVSPASSRRATVLFPDPGGPATTQAAAQASMRPRIEAHPVRGYYGPDKRLPTTSERSRPC